MKKRSAIVCVLTIVSALVAAEIAGCGSSKGGSGTPTPPPTPAPLVATVYDGLGQPVAGATLVRHRPDGTVISTVTTGTNGSVAIVVSAGDMVTAAIPDPVTPSLETVEAVKPGDHLTFGAPISAAADTTLAFHVTLPGPVAGATAYYVHDCSNETVIASTNAATTLNPSRACIGAGTDTLLAIAKDASGMKAYSVAKDVPTGAAANVTMPAWTTTLSSASLVALNIPANSAPRATALPMTNGRFWATFASRSIVAGSNQLPTIPAAALGADGYLYSAALTSGNAFTQLSRVDTNTSAPGTTVDYGTLLPFIYSLSVDTSVPARPSMSLPTDAAFASADYLAADVLWASGGWSVIAPAMSSGPLRFPALPASLSSWAPPAPSGTTQYSLGYFSSDLLNGYDDARQHALDVPTSTVAHDVFVSQTFVMQ